MLKWWSNLFRFEIEILRAKRKSNFQDRMAQIAARPQPGNFVAWFVWTNDLGSCSNLSSSL